jgi:hypothetical protein
MDIDWTNVFLFPLIMLLIEYLVLQPILQSRGRKIIREAKTDKSKYSWNDGIQKAVSNFKLINNSYHWRGIFLKQDFIKIKEFSPSKGQAYIFLSIIERYRFTLYQREIANFKLVADRVGDIRSSEELLTTKDSGNIFGFIISLGAWIIIALMILVSSEIHSLPSPKTPIIGQTAIIETSVIVEEEIQGNTLPTLWAYGIPLDLNTPINGTVEENNAKSYVFTTTNNEQITILLNPIGDFTCKLHIYNISGGLITTESIYANSKVNFAPEENSEYLIVIEPTFKGGSYTISIVPQSSIVFPEGRLSKDDAPSFELLWETAEPILLDTPINGTIGEKQFKTYIFESTENNKRFINIETMDNFHSDFYVYDKSGVLILEKSLYSNKKIEFAPEINKQYLFVIESVFQGGSYIISIDSSQDFWFFD